MAGTGRTGLIGSLIVASLVAAGLGVLWYSRQPGTVREPSRRPETTPQTPPPGVQPPTLGPPGRGLTPPRPTGPGARMMPGTYPGMLPAPSPEETTTQNCEAHLLQLSRALRMYTDDFDYRLPIADRWCDGIEPYVSGPEVLRCPVDPGRPGYAFNRNLDGRVLRDLRSPSLTVCLFESSAGKPNATDTGASLCRPPRHPRGNLVLFADAHYRHVRPEERPSFEAR